MIGRDLLDYAHGIHSRIPLCCIRAYIRGNAFIKSGADDSWDYSPCKQCLNADHRSAIHYCNYAEKCRDDIFCFVLDKITDLYNKLTYGPHCRFADLKDSVKLSDLYIR